MKMSSFNGAAGGETPETAASQGQPQTGERMQTGESPQVASEASASAEVASSNAQGAHPAHRHQALDRERAASRSPGVINAIQDRHFDELGRFHSAQYHGRERMLADFDRRFGARERQLRREIDERRELLENSGAARLLWLKITRQIPQDPRTYLEANQNEWDLIQHDREAANWRFDKEREDKLNALRERHLEERAGHGTHPRQGIAGEFSHATQAQDQSGAVSPVHPDAEPTDPRQERLHSLKNQRARLEADLDMPAPSNVGTAVNKHVEEQLAVEIAKLKASLGGEQDAHEEPELGEDP